MPRTRRPMMATTAELAALAATALLHATAMAQTCERSHLFNRWSYDAGRLPQSVAIASAFTMLTFSAAEFNRPAQKADFRIR